MKKLFLLLAAATAFCSFKGGSDLPLTLYVDAAHGGEDSGGKSAAGDKESEICLQFARMLEKKAHEKNIRVVMIRDKDAYVKLEDRAAISRDAPEHSYFISIHTDASENPAERGITVTTDRENKLDATILLARRITSELSSLGGVKINTMGILVLRKATIPAVMVSPGYITNNEDLQKMKLPEYQEMVAEKLIAAVSSF